MNQKKIQVIVLLRHDHFPNKTIYCVKRWIHIVHEDNPTHFFNATPLTSDEEESEEEEGVEEQIPDQVFHAGNNSEDIAHIRSLGLDVDDDNEPALEHIPDDASLPCICQTWGWNGIGYRAVGNYMDVKAVLLHHL